MRTSFTGTCALKLRSTRSKRQTIPGGHTRPLYSPSSSSLPLFFGHCGRLAPFSTALTSLAGRSKPSLYGRKAASAPTSSILATIAPLGTIFQQDRDYVIDCPSPCPSSVDSLSDSESSFFSEDGSDATSIDANYFDGNDCESWSAEECYRLISQEMRDHLKEVGSFEEEASEAVEFQDDVIARIEARFNFKQSHFHSTTTLDLEEDDAETIKRQDDAITRLEATLKAMHTQFPSTTTLDLDPSSCPSTVESCSTSPICDTEDEDEYLDSFVHLPALRSPRRKERLHDEFDSPYLCRAVLESNYFKALVACGIYH